MITPLFILWTVLLASVKSWNMTYFFPAHLSHIVMVFDLLRYSDIEGQRPYTLHSLCCKVILSPTIYFTLASSALMLFREEVWMSYNTKYMVASAWLVQPVLLNRLHIFLWQLRLKFPFLFVIISPMLLACWGCKCERLKASLICLKCGLYSKRPVYTWIESTARIWNAVTMPVYLCKSLQCTFVHNFVKTLRNYTNLFMSSFFYVE